MNDLDALVSGQDDDELSVTPFLDRRVLSRGRRFIGDRRSYPPQMTEQGMNLEKRLLAIETTLKHMPTKWGMAACIAATTFACAGLIIGLMTTSHVGLERYIDDIKENTKDNIVGLKKDIKEDIAVIQGGTKSDVAAFKKEIKGEIVGIQANIDKNHHMLAKLVGDGFSSTDKQFESIKSRLRSVENTQIKHSSELSRINQ